MMRIIYLSLCFLFIPILIVAQQPSKKRTNHPVRIVTENGYKTIQDPKFNLKAKTEERKTRLRAMLQNHHAGHSGRMMNEGPAEAQWTGAADDDWNNPDNWEDGEVPGTQTYVSIFPGDHAPRMPYTRDTLRVAALEIHDSHVEAETRLKIGSLSMYHASISSEYELVVYASYNTEIVDSELDLRGLRLTIAGGETNIYGSVFNGRTMYIEDEPDRDGAINIFNNEFNAHCDITNNATGSGTDYSMHIGNGDLHDVFNDNLYVRNNSNRSIIYMGAGDGFNGEPLIINSGLDINRAYDHSVVVDKITFGGYYSLFRAPDPESMPTGGPGGIGIIILPEPLPINKLFVRKEVNESVFVTDDITIMEQLFLSSAQGFLNMYDDKILRMEPGAVVIDEDPINGSFVQGKMMKTGSEAFTFPIGVNYQEPIYFRQRDPSSSSAGQRMMKMEGNFKAPLSISKPSASSKFTAQYLRDNPDGNGYDTSALGPEVRNIYGDGYWMLEREGAGSDVTVSLTYNKEHYSLFPVDTSDLRIAGWNGNIWVNHPAGNINGNEDAGTITTLSPVSVFGPLALHTGYYLRAPVITIEGAEEFAFCQGMYNFPVYFSIDTAAAQGTYFIAELSDEHGNFDDVIYNVGSTYADDGDDNVFVYLPRYLDYHNGSYRIRIRTDLQGSISTNTLLLVENRVPERPVIAGSDNICMDDNPFGFYTENRAEGADYTWSVNGVGTNIDVVDDTAWITFLNRGTASVRVQASNQCGQSPLGSKSIPVGEGSVDDVLTPVSMMLPADGSIDQKLPLSLSWLPSEHSRYYDVYIWEEGTVKPNDPLVSNIKEINYSIPENRGVEYGKTYNWQVNSSSGCLNIEGPVQALSMREVPDLEVTGVNAPATATSGQTITVSWKVKNTGNAGTLTHESWTDAIFFSFDEEPVFTRTPQINPLIWNAVELPFRPLLVGTRENVAALEPGEEYTNSIDFDIPPHYAQPLYIYVITNYKGGVNAPPQANYVNDTAKAQSPIVVTPAPTPDLRTESVTVPGSAFSGSVVNVTYVVKNYGVLTPAGSSWSDKIYLSKNPMFNKEDALLLNKPNANEMYYSADSAIFKVEKQLEQDASLTQSVDVVLPNFISGTWYIHVVANEDGGLYEGTFANNNDNSSSLQIVMTPTPQLSINTLTIPVTELSATQTVGVTWNVLNSGSFDNIEKSKGIYHVRTDEVCRTGSTGNVSGSVEVDSLSWGSSYWVDKVYLSTDPNGLNPANAILLGEAKKGTRGIGQRLGKDMPLTYSHCSGSVPSDMYRKFHASYSNDTRANVLRPGSNHPNNFDIKIPNDLPEGDYYIYIHSNATNTVFTFVDTPVVRRSQKLTVSWPDLQVAAVSVPEQITGGVSFNLNYTVSNTGQGSVHRARRTDEIYISTSPVFDESAELIKSVRPQEDVPAGGEVEHSVEIQLPHDASGTIYFFVKVNAAESFAETNINNNINTTPAIATAVNYPPADLAISSITVADTNYVAGAFYVHYTVENVGDNPANGLAEDEIYVSCGPVFDPGTAKRIATNRKRRRNIAAGASMADSVRVSFSQTAYNYDTCFAKADYSNVYFHVKINTTGSIFEGNNTGNNVGSTAEKVFGNRNADLEIHDIVAGDSGQVGRPYNMRWFTSNIGKERSYLRLTQVFFSKDSVFNEHAIPAKGKNIFTPEILAGKSIEQEELPMIPRLVEGNYYVFVFADSEGKLFNEINRENNIDLLRDESGRAQKVYIESPLLSDLQGEIFSTPATVAVGQPVRVKYRVTNTGDGVTYPGKWTDDIWLSKGTTPGRRDGSVLIDSKTHNGELNKNEFYEDSATAFIPVDIEPGNYMLVVHIDKNDDVVEDNDDNNRAVYPITVYVPEPSDLVVDEIAAPDTIYLGYQTDSIRWVIKNMSVNPAEGVSTDGIYLSKNPQFDSSATLIGVKKKEMSLSALGTDTVVLKPVIDNVPEGEYHLIVRADIQNNILETDKMNNESVMINRVYVSVKELMLNESVADTMSASRYYKLRIPDSLLGATVLLTLKSADSLSVTNEVYVGGGYIPSVIKSDYKHSQPNYGNQQILLSDITDTIYYIHVRTIPACKQQQNITLSAEELPFALLGAHSNRGGNGGNVTVKLTGSLFSKEMTARLRNSGNTIDASQIHFVNSTLAYATFPLFAEPIGVYDIVLTREDDSEAILTEGFSVVSPDNGGLYSGGGVNTGQVGTGSEPGCDPGALAGLNSQLVTELIIPKSIAYRWAFPIQINYSNPTNMDIPVQTKILVNDFGLIMSFDKNDVENGSEILYVELSETDGPPGVIRAGSSGSITIYSITPFGDRGAKRVNFELK